MNKSSNTNAFFVASTYPNGLMTVAVEGSGDADVDGQTLLSFHEFAGVEIGPSSIIAQSGEASMQLFEGTYEEQKAVFDKWNDLAKRNTRPQVFLDGGLEALVQLGRASKPPLPAVDVELTERTNRVLEASRRRILEMGEIKELTLEDCERIAEEVDADLEDV